MCVTLSGPDPSPACDGSRTRTWTIYTIDDRRQQSPTLQHLASKHLQTLRPSADLNNTIRAYTHPSRGANVTVHQRAKDSHLQHAGQPRAPAIIKAATSRPDREYSPRPGQHSPAADGSRATSSVKLVSPAAPPGREDDTKTPNETRSCNTRKIRPPHTCTSNTSIRPAPCSASMANGPSSTLYILYIILYIYIYFYFIN